MKSNIASLCALIAAGVLAASPGRVFAGDAPARGATIAAMSAMSSTSGMSAADERFVLKAAQGGNAEISLGRLALQKSNNAGVKSFAQKMIADHTANAAKLASVVASAGGTPPPKTLSPADAAMRAKLAQLSGAAFDTAYLKGQVAGHEKMAALMQKEAAGGTNAALKSFATATLPTVQNHLSLAQKSMDAAAQ